MGRKRGFLAEIQHQAAVAQRQKQRATAAAERDGQRARKEAERATAAAVRAQQAAARADARTQAAAEKEAKRLHIEAMEAMAASANVELTGQLADIDSILTFTLDVDDYVDLEKLRKHADHPPFRSSHQDPIRQPPAIVAPREPVYIEPGAPSGLFGRKKKQAVAIEEAQAAHAAAHAAWQAEVAATPRRQLEQLAAHSEAEAERVRLLAFDQAAHAEECAQRQRQVDDDNAQLNALIIGLAEGRADAVDEYTGIVLGNSVYPDGIEIGYEYEYDEATRELRMDLELPSPDRIPTTRGFKYVRARDEISESAQPLKEQRDRYAGLLHNTALRTLHEVFEADRNRHVKTISLAVGTNHIAPATGTDTFTPLLAVAVARGDFEGIDLSRVTPAETLKHFGAVLSKDPRGLTAISTTLGVRSH